MPESYSERLVYTETEDRMVLEGVMVQPLDMAQPNAILWIHGFPGNFYRPFYIQVGRWLAGNGLAFVSGNTRGHDLGALILRRGGPPLRGGSWWERFDESPRDLSAWIDFTVALGFEGVVLVGYSLGATKVIQYQAARQDPRVRALAVVSGPVRRGRGVTAEFVAVAQAMVEAGQGEALMPSAPWHSSTPPPLPGPVSAQTYLSWARNSLDVFGLDSPRSALAEIRCPVFACYGSNEPDIGTAADLSLIRRNAVAAPEVCCQLFAGADHSYAGHEEDLARAISVWVKELASSR